MNTSLLLALIDGSIKGTDSFLQGAIVAVLCIVMVFVILAFIIGVTYVVNIIIAKFAKKQTVEENNCEPVEEKSKLDVNDEDAVVATLIASIDLRNETKKNVKVISVKEIK